MEAQIFSLRQKVGKKKQKQYEDCLDKLETEIKDKGSFAHPYAWSSDLLKLLNENDEFRSGANGKACNKGSVKTLYRICTIKSILNVIKESNKLTKLKSSFNENNFIPTASSEELYQQIKLYSGPNWTSYQDVFEDKFLCWRDFAWWTTENLEVIISGNNQESIIRTGHGLGLHNELLKENFYFLMKLDVTDNNTIYQIKIPSVIDAFDSPIFNPMNYDDSKINFGTTINLQSFEDSNWSTNILDVISSGYQELVVKNIPVSKVMIKAFRVNIGEVSNKKNISFANYNSLLPLLREFYSLLQ